ncbi:MAG: MBL fold metallo-hydrolase [Halothiobacillaceae bacterium]
MKARAVLMAGSILAASVATAGETYQPKAEQVVDNVYAIIGPINDRTYENLGMNANYGFVVTEEGVILIDSGATRVGAEPMLEAVADVTGQPARWVINLGVQDHRWLGNQAFAEQGAEIIAFEATVKSQQNFAEQHLSGRLKDALKEQLDGTEPAYAARVLEGDSATLELGGETFELSLTNAHFPGDAMLYLPRQDVAFTGDLVYVDRMLGVHPWSSVANAHEAYGRLKAIDPEHVVPGHGQVSDMARAQRDTGDYYEFLVNVVGEAARNFEPIDEVMEANREVEAFKHLKHYDSWHGTNMSRAFLQYEGM